MSFERVSGYLTKLPSASTAFRNKIADYILSPILLKATSEGEMCERSDVIWRDTSESVAISLNEYEVLGEQVQSVLSGFTTAESDEEQIVYQPPEKFLIQSNDVDVLMTTAGGRVSDHVMYFGTDGVVGPVIYSGEARSEKDLKYLVRVFTQAFGVSGLLKYYIDKRFTGSVSISPKETIDIGLPLITRHENNYGHWLIETLPKVRRAKRYRDETGRWPTLIVPENLSEFQRETLKLLGLREDDWKSVDDWPVRVNEFVLPDTKNFNTANYIFSPDDCRWIARTMKSNVDTSSQNYPSRVFISRQQMPKRQILNFEEVEQVLSTYGFSTVRPEEMSIEEQISLFEHADIVVGSFGAALSNLIFCQDTQIVCLYPPGWVSGMFFTLAQSFGHDWRAIYSEEIEGETEKRVHERDILVDIESLENTVDELITG